MSEDVQKRWPHIARFLTVDDASDVGYDFVRFCCVENTLGQTEMAAANEEWADYFEYRLAQRAEELDRDHVKRHLVEEWTDSMVYLSRRCACHARGEDPGALGSAVGAASGPRRDSARDRRGDHGGARRGRVGRPVGGSGSMTQDVAAPIEVVRCSQGCDVTGLLNRLEQRMNQLTEDWEQVRAGIDTMTERLGDRNGG